MIKINKVNTKKLVNAIEKYGDEAVKEVSSITKITALEVESKAKQFAPKDKGDLAQNIRSEQQETSLHYKVTAYMPYSAYQEFGTGGFVDIKEDWGEMASKFKGKGIKQINLRPKPFMYPAYVIGRKMYNKELKQSFKELAKRFNNG